MTVNDIVHSILKTSRAHKPVIIGIEGFGGSGKTTLANALSSKLDNSYVVSIDDFINKENLNKNSWDQGTFDRQRLEKQVLIPASKNKVPRYQKLIWQSNKLSDFIKIPRTDYLIIEGISCYHPDIATYYDFKIWVETPLTVAQKRGHLREGSSENASMWDLWATNDISYKDKYHPELKADFIFDNSSEKNH